MSALVRVGLYEEAIGVIKTWSSTCCAISLDDQRNILLACAHTGDIRVCQAAFDVVQGHRDPECVATLMSAYHKSHQPEKALVLAETGMTAHKWSIFVDKHFLQAFLVSLQAVGRLSEGVRAITEESRTRTDFLILEVF